MKTHFLNERIRLEDLLPPGAGVVEGKTFEGCDLIGPLNIGSVDCGWYGNFFESVDHILINWEAAGNIRNARIFRDCTFKKCKFYNVSFLIAEANYQQTTDLGGANWITPVPKKDPPPTPLDKVPVLE